MCFVEYDAPMVRPGTSREEFSESVREIPLELGTKLANNVH
jgi:hypothetical protein